MLYLLLLLATDTANPPTSAWTDGVEIEAIELTVAEPDGKDHVRRIEFRLVNNSSKTIYYCGPGKTARPYPADVKFWKDAKWRLKVFPSNVCMQGADLREHALAQGKSVPGSFVFLAKSSRAKVGIPVWNTKGAKQYKVVWSNEATLKDR